MSEYKLELGFRWPQVLPKEVGHYINKLESQLQQVTQELETLKAENNSLKNLCIAHERTIDQSDELGAASTYFMLVDELLPNGGSLVDYVYALKEENETLKAQALEGKKQAFKDGFMLSGEGYNGELYQDGWKGVIESFDKELATYAQELKE